MFEIPYRWTSGNVSSIFLCLFCFRCRIVDARYSYEYEGGHIRGAENFGTWNEEAFLAEFFPPYLGPKVNSPRQNVPASYSTSNVDESDALKVVERRDIVIFHCEFFVNFFF